MESVTPLEVTLVRIRLILNEQTNDDGVALEAGDVKRSLQHFVPCVHLCTLIQEVLD